METASRIMLSVIIPCFNEERNIASCLKSVSWADEILVVDSFSTDRTLEIAQQYTDRILRHEYINSATQKNWAIPQALHDWVLIVDCDERVTAELRDDIATVLKQEPLREGYWVKRKNYLFGEEIKYSGWGTDSVLRLFRRDLGRYQEKRVHAEVNLQNTGVLRGFLEHHSVSSLSDWINKINRYSSWKAQDKYEKGAMAPVLHMMLRPPMRFFKDYILRLGILDGWRGFLIASMSAFAELVMAAKIAQISIERGRKP
jgi:glycosyltransferase involved in cell wall biosynthesis